MSVERCSSKYFLAVLSGLVLSACSPSASTAVPPVQAAVPPPSVEPPAATAPVAPLVTGLPDFTGLVERYGPAVVNVKVSEKLRSVPARGRGAAPEGAPADPFSEFLRRYGFPGMPGAPGSERGTPQPSRGEGSGFIVSADGYILTNAHVVRGAAGDDSVSQLTVKLTDKREFPAKVIGLDDRTDVAVIKIEGGNLPTVRIGDPSKLKPGQWVIAIGSPFGMENSVTAGIVSAISRTLPSSDPNDGYVPFIQTDVAVNPGNSGGPLFNLSGEVVGINSQIYSQSGGYMGLSFAIPIDMANDVREQLVRDGRVTRGMINVKVEPVNAAFAEAFGLERPRGALVQDVGKGGPADKAGIRPGDIILSVNGRPVESNSAALSSMISAIRPGSSAELEIWSDRKLRKVTVQVTELQQDGVTAASASPRRGDNSSATPAESSVFGLAVRPLTAEEKQQLGTDGSLVIERVNGAAEEQGLRPGDVILGANGSRVKSVAELQAAGKRGGRFVALQVQRGELQRFVTIPVAE